MSNNKCIYCSQDKENASMLCGGTGSHSHSFPKPDTVTISRECAEWIKMDISRNCGIYIGTIGMKYYKELTELLENKDD